MPLFRRARSYIFLFFGLMIVLTFQQCGDIGLHRYDGMAVFASSGFPFLMKAPTQFPVYRRYVLLVDMSNSMISGPCPFDRDVADSVGGFSGPYYPWDPNPTKTDPNANINDGRAMTRDCYVNPALTPPNMVVQTLPRTAVWNSVPEHQTYPGADPNADRITVVKTWLSQLRTNLQMTAAQRTEILLMPVTGGAAQRALEAGGRLPLGFVNLFDPRLDDEVNYLKAKHDLENTLVKMQVLPRWIQTMSLDSKMGTTSSGEMMTRVYGPINNSYKALAQEGLLTGTSFDVVLFGDGHITPLTEHFTRTLDLFGGCSCTGSLCLGVCSELWQDMRESWGDPDANKVEAVDLKFSVLQAMPRFYGGGYLDSHLVQINPDHYKKKTNNAKSEFETLVELSTARKARLKLWKMLGPLAPFDLAASRSATTTFKMTHLFLLNPNVRVNLNSQLKIDSDGDGLPDDEEVALGLEPTNARTNGFCLDSMMANPTFSPKCESLKNTNGCDASLDSDGDSLNECEEMVLGTDPYDFDTDGDGLPDSLEWLYGYNPLRPDTEMDSNADGYNNMIAFAAGLPPQLDYNSVPGSQKIQYDTKFLGQEVVEDAQLGSVRVDSYNVKINSMPSAQLRPVDPNRQPAVYLNRLVDPSKSRQASLIPAGHKLIKSVGDPTKNIIMGLMRTIDPDEPRRVYWQIVEMPFDVTGLGGERQIDLSAFEQMRVMDRQQEGN